MKPKFIRKKVFLLMLSFSVSLQSVVLLGEPVQAQDAQAQVTAPDPPADNAAADNNANNADNGGGNGNDAGGNGKDNGDGGTVDNGGFLDEFFNLFGSLTDVFSLVQSFVTGNVQNIFGAFSPVIDRVLGQVKPGVLKVFNPNAARKQLNAEVTNNNAALGDASGRNRFTRATAEGNSLDREITRGGVEAYLGEEGQKKIEEEIKQVDKLVKSSSTAAKDAGKSAKKADSLSKEAQKLDVTQDVQKRIASQNAEAAKQAAKISAQLSQQTQILGATRTDALKARADAQLANTNLTNISSTIDSMKKQEDAKLFSMTSRNAATAYQSGLDYQKPK
jgi:hypothetical protein